jgi:hypothetical protein
MEKTMTKLSLALLFILTAACGKAPSMKVPAEGKHGEPLVGKSNAEILNLKYNNKISLDCVIRVKKGPSIDLNASPTDSFSWDIPGELSIMRVLNFKLGNTDTVVVVKLADNIKFIDNQTVIDEKQHEYFMEHSPVLTIAFRRDSKTILSNGSVHEQFKFKNVKLSENVETRIFTMTSEDNDGNELTEDFRCTLKTKINPAYQYQWKLIR